jgi:hypothetical protein
MGVDLDGTILLLAPAAEPATLRLTGTGVPHRSGRQVLIAGTSRKVDMVGTAPLTTLE